METPVHMLTLYPKLFLLIAIFLNIYRFTNHCIGSQNAIRLISCVSISDVRLPPHTAQYFGNPTNPDGTCPPILYFESLWMKLKLLKNYFFGCYKFNNICTC